MNVAKLDDELTSNVHGRGSDASVPPARLASSSRIRSSTRANATVPPLTDGQNKRAPQAESWSVTPSCPVTLPPVRCPGRYHWSGLMSGLESKVFGRLPDATWVYPGHGADLPTLIDR
ncbi:MAG: hypothetical protein ABSA02_32775 [Trebonia sp.]